MTTGILHICPAPGCTTLSPEQGRCPEHHTPNRAGNHARTERKRRHRRGTKHWRQLRAHVLDRDHHQCQRCGCDDRSILTVHLDPRLEGQHDQATPDDCLTLCRSCHGSHDAPRAHKPPDVQWHDDGELWATYGHAKDARERRARARAARAR